MLCDLSGPHSRCTPPVNPFLGVTVIWIEPTWALEIVAIDPGPEMVKPGEMAGIALASLPHTKQSVARISTSRDPVKEKRGFVFKDKWIIGRTPGSKL